MKNNANNYAFIDSQNLHLSIQHHGWKLDYEKFRTYLAEKYGVTKAYLFIGYIDGNEDLYKSLQESGFICIFKPTLEYQDGTTKGNCDADLVLHAMIELDNFDKAVIVSGDGDFYCLVQYLMQRKKLEKLMIPNQNHYSALLKRFSSEHLAFVSDLKKKLEYRPHQKRKRKKKRKSKQKSKKGKSSNGKKRKSKKRQKRNNRRKKKKRKK